MAIKIVRKGNSSVANDHNLLYNRGMLNQHPMEAITGLISELDSKYVKPEFGIPASDLAFSIVTTGDLNNAVSVLEQKILVIKNDIGRVDYRVDILEDLLNKISGDTGFVEDSTINFAYSNGFREDFITNDKDTIFNLSNKFIANGKHLKVYRDGELLNPNIDYIESSDNQVIMNYPLEADVIMTFICETMSTIMSPVHEEILSMEGQITYNLKNRYNVGEHSLSIFVNGIRLECDKHYTEVNQEQIDLKIPPFNPGTNVIFRQEILSSAGKVLYHGNDYNQKSWSVDFIAKQGQRIIDIGETFIPGSNMINVMCDGLLQWKGSSADYIEVDANTIKFNYDLDEGDHVRITCIAATCEWTEKFIGNHNQTVFKLENPYHVGKFDIQVYENGLLLQPEWDYEETNYNTVTFKEPVEFGSKITFIKRR